MAVRQPTLRGVPHKSPLGGYIYAIRFSIDVIKVGMTVSPAKRLPTHFGYSRGLGISVTDHWVSAPHVDPEKNEAELITFCRANAEQVNAREYFVGLQFDDVVSFAETLRYIPSRHGIAPHALVNAPRWRETYIELRKRIADGTYPPGERLPSVVDVCGEFGISQVTARRVLTELRQAGLAVMYPGVGTYVTKLPQPPA